MKPTITLFAAGLMAAALATPALAQEGMNAQPGVRVVDKGNLVIVAEGAPNDDPNLGQYRAFEWFAAHNPKLVEDLGKNPRLVDNDKYLSQHPQLAEFMSTNPKMKSDFDMNPGNYIRLAPGVESAAEKRAKSTESVSPLPTDEGH